jgi:hypothetical protein
MAKPMMAHDGAAGRRCHPPWKAKLAIGVDLGPSVITAPFL